MSFFLTLYNVTYSLHTHYHLSNYGTKLEGKNMTNINLGLVRQTLQPRSFWSLQMPGRLVDVVQDQSEKFHVCTVTHPQLCTEPKLLGLEL